MITISTNNEKLIDELNLVLKLFCTEDEILEINGVSTKGITVEAAADKIRGPEGTYVKLLVKRKNEEGATVTEKREVKLTYQDFRKHASGISAMLTEPLIFDVMEVSAIRKDWFEAVNKACDALSGNLKRMDHARMRWSLKVYAAEYAKFAENRKRCMELLSRRKQFEFGQKSDAMKKLKQDNRIRRAKAYRAALLQRQQEKAEGKNKPGGKK